MAYAVCKRAEVAAAELEPPLGHTGQRHELAPLDPGIEGIERDAQDAGGLVGAQDLVVVARRRDDDRRRHRHNGAALPIEPLLAHDAQQMKLRARQLVDKFGELVEGKECGGGGEGTSMHG